jgi:hypothetical protein
MVLYYKWVSLSLEQQMVLYYKWVSLSLEQEEQRTYYTRIFAAVGRKLPLNIALIGPVFLLLLDENYL